MNSISNAPTAPFNGLSQNLLTTNTSKILMCSVAIGSVIASAANSSLLFGESELPIPILALFSVSAGLSIAYLCATRLFINQRMLNPSTQQPLQENAEQQFRRDVADGNIDKVSATLCEGNIDLSSCGPSGNTALHYACERNNGPMIKVLIDAGADIEVMNAKRRRPYEMRALDNHYRQLLKETQFRRDVANGNIDKVLATLCEGNIDLSSCGPSGDTALHFACLKNDTEMIMVLINAGADTDTVNKDGFSPVDSPNLSTENQTLLQEVRESRLVLAELDQALEKCTHSTDTNGYFNFGRVIQAEEKKATKNCKENTEFSRFLIHFQAHFNAAIQTNTILMGCGFLSMLVTCLLLEKQTDRSIDLLVQYLKSDENNNHSFVVINSNGNHPYTLGSQQQVYVVDGFKNKSFFSYIDETMFLSIENIPKNTNRCQMRLTLLKKLCGDVPTALDPSTINLFSYSLAYRKKVSQSISLAESHLRTQVITLGRHLINLMMEGKINVLHRGFVKDRYHPDR